MRAARILIYILLALIGVLAIAGFLTAYLFLVPPKPKYPYFSEKTSSFSQLEWKIGEMQPVYLWTYSKQEGIFYKVILRDKSNKIKLIDVLVYTKDKGGNITSGPFFILGGKEYDPSEVTNKSFKLGQQIHVWYLIDTKGMAPDSIPIMTMCENSPNMCKISKYISQINDTRFEDLSKGVVSKSLDYLPAMGISTDLLSK